MAPPALGQLSSKGKATKRRGGRRTARHGASTAAGTGSQLGARPNGRRKRARVLVKTPGSPSIIPLTSPSSAPLPFVHTSSLLSTLSSPSPSSLPLPGPATINIVGTAPISSLPSPTLPAAAANGAAAPPTGPRGNQRPSSPLPLSISFLD